VTVLRIRWITAFAAVAVLCSYIPASGQQSTNLTPGLNQEQSLGPADNHIYTINLSEGAAVLGEADQHGVDLVIDIFAPDGKLIRTVDSPNGAEGPEPIDLTAFTAGEYKLVIHTADKTAEPGKYVMKIDRVITADENGQRLAEKNYPPAIFELWKGYVKDPHALDRFAAARKGKGPFVEAIKDDNKDVNVTYLYYGDENTESVQVFGGVRASVGGTQMERFLRTPLFFGTETLPKDSRFRYGFSVIETRFVGPERSIQISDENDITDPFNPEVFSGLSVLALPDAPPQPYIVENKSVPHGKVTPGSIKSESLNQDRAISIYTPPGYESGKASDLLIVLDGESYDGGAASLIPTPTILDNLIAAGKIGPTVAIFVNNTDRNRDLGGYPPFSDFIALELAPWARKNYHIADGPSHVVLAGSSRGGVAASHCALLHSDVMGNVLSQSGAFFVRKDDPPPAWPVTEDSGDLLISFRNSPRVPVRFYMEVGRFDSLVALNREMRDILLLKGYPLDYREFDGGHDYFYWRGSLADGIISLLGQRKD
jgi:enterochelin esterase-like enzyme